MACVRLQFNLWDKKSTGISFYYIIISMTLFQISSNGTMTVQEKIVEGNRMTLFQVSFVAIISMIILVWQWKMRERCKGALVWPILGLIPSMLFHYGHLYDWFTHLLVLNGGTFRLCGPWRSRIVTAHPANMEYLVKTRYHNFGKGDGYKDAFRDLFGDSILVLDGEQFTQMNKSVTRAFALPAFRNKAVATITAAVHQKLLPLLCNAAEKNTAIDLQEIFMRLAFDNLCMLGFGDDPGSLNLDLSRVPFLEAFDGAIEALLFRMAMPPFWWKTMRYLNLGWEHRIRSGRATVYDFVDKVLARRNAAGHDHYSPQCSEILWTSLRLEQQSGREHSHNTVRSSMVSLVMAGKDTVSAGLTYFFWLLAQHPQVEAKVLAELRGILNQSGDEEEEERDPRPFSFEEVKQMDYLHAALSESLRLYPPIPAEASEAAQDDVLPDGTAVEKGARVYYLIYSSARMESVWGRDCLEFKPERWLKKDRFQRESVFKFCVFNGGPRQCTGREFAYWQMKWAAASILIRYQVTMKDKHPPVVPKFTIALTMKYGLPVMVRRR